MLSALLTLGSPPRSANSLATRRFRIITSAARTVVTTVTALATRLDGPAAHERAILATVDLPYGAIRRRLLGGKPPPRALDGPVAAAARAILEGVPA